jgi:hypothetical protein
MLLLLMMMMRQQKTHQHHINQNEAVFAAEDLFRSKRKFIITSASILGYVTPRRQLGFG